MIGVKHVLSLRTSRLISRALVKVSWFNTSFTMYSIPFVFSTRHNLLCICHVGISKEYFRFWGALCGLFANKSSIASLALLHKTSPYGRMVSFNSLRGTNKPRNGAQNLLRESIEFLREANKPRNGAQNVLRHTEYSLRGTSNHSNVILTVLRHTENFLRETNNHSNVTERHYNGKYCGNQFVNESILIIDNGVYKYSANNLHYTLVYLTLAHTDYVLIRLPVFWIIRYLL